MEARRTRKASMKETWQKKPPSMDGIKKINGNISRQMGLTKRLRVATLNSHLICVLCSGYYVEATAIVECLHTFCRSCIVKYLQSNNFCPICDVQIHQAKPWSSLRPDKTLQDLVYKLVPGLYHDEMRRRRQFYSHLGGDVSIGEGEEGGFLIQGARFFSQDDSISLSLEYYNGQEEEMEGEEDDFLSENFKNPNERPKRYLQCPAAVTVRHLKKFLRMKYGIGLDCWVDVIYNDECLPEDFSLIDVAYTFTWKRTSPMRFSYRIFSKAAIKTVKSNKNFQTSRVDEGEGKKSKNQSTLEQQMQNEYLGNFNLNPTNSGFCKTQNYSRNKSNCNNNNNNSVKNNNQVNDKNRKKDEYLFKDCEESEEGSRDKIFQSSEESNASGLRIILEKEESIKENSEDSQESTLVEEKVKRKSEASIANFGEEAVDSFTAKKLLKNKHKLEARKEKRKYEESHGDKRRKSAGHAEEYEKTKKKCGLTKRRRTIADELSMSRETERKMLASFSVRKEEEEMALLGNLKNEALRKVFVTKEKPEVSSERKEEEVRRKKRKKSKHREGEPKKRKSELIPSSPSIMSFAKDPLKLKVKLTPNKSVIKATIEKEDKTNDKKVEAEDSDKVAKKSGENSESKKAVSDKERLLHLRAVRHKNIVNKSSPKDYISAPPSLTISKIDSSEQQPVKSTLVESRPSLEIMLVNPSDNSKVKKIEVKGEASHKEADAKKSAGPPKETRRSEVIDNFGVLDLSEKSTRTKENGSNSSSPKDSSDTVERCKKSTHQSILQIAQTLVNRKLAPILPDNQLRAAFDVPGDSTAAAMRNLKTLSDTAVNILMAAQSKNFPACAEPPKRPFPSSISPPLHKPLVSPNGTKPSKDCENGAGLKIPVFPISRERANPMPPVPNLHEIYPRGRGRLLPFGKPPAPMIKPGQNQTVRQIPNPFVVLNRQGNQNAIKASPSHVKSPPKPENGEESRPAKEAPNPSPPAKTKTLIAPKLDDLTDLSNEKSLVNDLKAIVPKIMNNNTKTVQNGSEGKCFGMKNGDDRKGTVKLNTSLNSIRKIENMAKNIESVAAGLTARAVSNAMIDAK